MVNRLPKYVGSTTLSGDLEWNATLLEGDLEESIPKLKNEVDITGVRPALSARVKREGSRCS